MEKKSLRKRKTLQNAKRKNAGITLIALVITIVVLVILATITINFAFGENGLVSMTEDARDITTEATEKEGIEMAVADSKIKDTTTPDREKENLEESLRSQFGNDANFTVTENGDGSFLINMSDSQRSYYVESTGEIIAQSEWIEIGTAEELKAFRGEVNSGNTFEGKYIRLTNNITLDSSEEWEPIGVYNSEATSITDERNTYFSGIFDGCNYTISGIYINTENRGNGLFGIIKNGRVQNLEITNSNFIINYNAGAITGFLQNSQIINCYSNINIETKGSNLINIGGLAGNVMENSEINNSYNSSTIIASGESSQIGGIVGAIDNSAIRNCYNIGKIEGNEMVGGIAGYNNNCIIYNCYNSNNITGNSDVGSIMGKVGNKGLEITNCYYLENTVNGTNETDAIKGVTVKTSEELKELAPILGSAFKDDYEEENINDGYPILSWQ